MKIAVLAVYFGALPEFTQLFLASCSKNREIDFILVGDAWNAVDGDVPKNCTIHGIDLDEFKLRIEKYIHVKPVFSSPYKICDFKPVLGLILQDLLVGYDYWGFCDIDIVLGDLSGLTKDLSMYDVFSTRAEYLSGPLFFFRNSAAVNQLYLRSKDWEKVYSTDKHFCFDECAFVWGELHSGKRITDIETETESMTEVIVKACEQGVIRASFKTLALEPERNFSGRIDICKGAVMFSGESYMHYHHLHNKGRAGYTYPDWHWAEVPEHYTISKHGVFGGAQSLQLIYRTKQSLKLWLKRIRKRLPI